ncbi:hypothetical protein EMIHUDRAFT_255580 [Emiliania huxleyi CCMP1516]|uniref:Uncharacterized protein n=2 Tax=Emiliania huxleyi TaxID=2903 RepID=A0A0D3J8I6_EMIH1|nr:hypothetical protein EMIHUDRAFT_255580 [Emiliania huxleyi CCMP1516]EOD19821.1 hypothetical protein EMIHUDRAFT_255580 [Emiliania huxleyi CCMP1516]|eukprot:XP_005772250.1 hypothetical protein EMIHUDRAFT_255580 [Emiliania huxleyi CCMP1516]
MEIEGDQELSSGRKAKAARTEKLPPAVEGRAEPEGLSSPSAPDKVKALFTGAVMTPELAPKSTLHEEGNLCPQSGLSPPGVNMNTPWALAGLPGWPLAGSDGPEGLGAEAGCPSAAGSGLPGWSSPRS